MSRILWALLWPIRWYNARPRPEHVPLFITYGTWKGSRARRYGLTGCVEFVLWKAGEQGHAEDFWYPMHADHWPEFIADERL